MPYAKRRVKKKIREEETMYVKKAFVSNFFAYEDLLEKYFDDISVLWINDIREAVDRAVEENERLCLQELVEYMEELGCEIFIQV